MPWQKASLMEIRKELVLRALEPGANISELASEYGVSRKTVHKWLNRFRAEGLAGLQDRSRCPHDRKLAASGEVVMKLIELRQRNMTWGAKKLHRVILRTEDEADVPSVRTVARIIERAGLVRRRRSSVPDARPSTAPNPPADAPNDLWTFDFKGWWRTGDGSRCEPLTVRDAASRFVLATDVFESPKQALVRASCERLFEQYGLPKGILIDNGAPFACTRARGGLTRLSAWWVSLGITVYRSRPGSPQDNGGHERMHGDIALEVEATPSATLELEQATLDLWRHKFNHVRPHEALEDRCPAEVYTKSTRRYQGSRRFVYPRSFATRKVSSSGCCNYSGHVIRVSKALAGFHVGLHVFHDELRVRFFELDLGTIDIPGIAA